MAPTTSPHELGRRGEDLAARFYRERGFDILARNWRCAEGEIDVIASSDATIVFCEVKTRASRRFGSPAEGLSRRQQGRIRAAASVWLAQESGWYREVRFDVAEIVNPHIEVIEAAF